VTATPPPPPSTTTAPALAVTVTAVADYPSLTADCAADPIASFTGTVTANQTVTVAYQWVRSDGTRTAGQQLSLSSGKAVQVKDNTWDTGSGSPQPTGSEKLVVTTRSGLTFSSTAANYTINCVGVSLTTQNQTFKGCTTATPGKVYFTGDVAGLPNSRVTYAYVLDFTAGSPNHQQGVWTTITLDGTGHSTISFWGSSDVSNTITGSVLFQSANGNFPFGNAVGTLTCV
jgi:hypothetical protein